MENKKYTSRLKVVDSGSRRSRRGIVYSISLFMLLAVIISLMLFWSEHAQRRIATLQPFSDGEVMDWRLAELVGATQGALGANATLWRNNITMQLNISDWGFPLPTPTSNPLGLSGLKNWLEANWTATTHATLTLDVAYMNSSGILFGTSDGISYKHNNSNSSYDNATLAFPGSTVPTNLTLAIYCQAPTNATVIQYTDWTTTGSAMQGTINFSSDITTHGNSVLFDIGTDNQFSAKFLNAATWMRTLHADWVRPNYTLSIWTEDNSTYTPALSKSSVRCFWNVSATLNSTSGTQSLWMPANVSFGYGNASYGSYLTIARK